MLPPQLRYCQGANLVSRLSPRKRRSFALGGEVDLLDSTTLVGLTETLVALVTEGNINLINPSAWEHIDIQLFIQLCCL